MSAEPLRLRILNVGQGSCALLELPGGRWGLIDCHKRYPGKPSVLTLVKGREKNLAFIILTHPHEDHILGVSDVIKAVHEAGHTNWKLYETDFQVWLAELAFLALDKGSAAQLNEVLKLNDLIPDEERVPLNPSKSRWLTDGLWCEVLAPSDKKYQELGERVRKLAREKYLKDKATKPAPKGPLDFNEVSLGLLLIYAPSTPKGRGKPKEGARILIGGDVVEDAWIELARAKKLEPVDVAIVPHHGGSGNPKELWKNVSRGPGEGPHSTISCGSYRDTRNRPKKAKGYGHPDCSTLVTMTKAGARIHCTNLGHQCTDSKIADRVSAQWRAAMDAPTIDLLNEHHRRGPGTPTPIDVVNSARRNGRNTLECSDDVYLMIHEDGAVIPILPEIRCERKGRSSSV